MVNHPTLEYTLQKQVLCVPGSTHKEDNRETCSLEAYWLNNVC